MKQTYLITNLITGDEYIGVTGDRKGLKQRLIQHKCRAKKGSHNHLPLYENINQYGWSNFTTRVLCEGDEERYYIWLLRPSLNQCFHNRKCPPHVARASAVSHHKPVKCVETGVVYESITEATNSLGCSRGSISNHLRGKTGSAGGYTWKFLT